MFTTPSNVLLFTPQANFPTHNLNFHWKWRWWDPIRAIFLNLFYFLFASKHFQIVIILWISKDWTPGKYFLIDSISNISIQAYFRKYLRFHYFFHKRPRCPSAWKVSRNWTTQCAIKKMQNWFSSNTKKWWLYCLLLKMMCSR